MQTELKIAIMPSELVQIVDSVFETMMGLETIECDTPWFPHPDRLLAAIHLTGDWNGAVLLECTPEQACRFTGRFLSIDAPPAVDNIVRDVLGELANMVGGNLKCVLADGIRLSVPSVVDGSDYSLRICGASVQKRVTFDSVEGVFWISVLAMPSKNRVTPSRISSVCDSQREQFSFVRKQQGDICDVYRCVDRRRLGRGPKDPVTGIGPRRD